MIRKEKNFSKNQYDLNRNISVNNHKLQGTLKFRSNDSFDTSNGDDNDDDDQRKIKPDNDCNKKQPHAFDRANIISKLYCFYAFSFLWKNYNKDFDLDSFDHCASYDECCRLSDRLQKYVFVCILSVENNFNF